MPFTILNPNNYININVLPAPAPQPEDLIYAEGGGTIFPNLQPDQTSGGFWYHGGNTLLDTEDVTFFGDQITASVTTVPVISAQKQKGLFEIRRSSSVTISGASNNNPCVLTVNAGELTASNIVTGDFIEITGITSLTVPDGIYKVTGLTSNTITIEFDSTSTPVYVASTPSLTRLQYIWDEVYTTPLGLYREQATSLVVASNYRFHQNTSNEFEVHIRDVNIIPKVGDYFLVQKFFDNVNSFTNMSTTDGYNNVKNYSEADTYVFKITNVIPPSSPAFVYIITFDKSFTPDVNEYFMFVLLNRNGGEVYKDLLTDVFQSKEVHRSQLLGDPYDYIGTTLPEGRKNYLYYSGADFLGQVALLEGILEAKSTPFIVLDAYDELKDRIYDGTGDLEVHIPTVMIQGNKTPVILTNNAATQGPANGVGRYAPLTIKYSTDTTRYGWVFYDLRIIVLDHSELATAMAYNSNRNYTLPAPILPKLANTTPFPTPSAPLAISTAINSNPALITTALPHPFIDGDKVTILGVTGNTVVNSGTTADYWYAKKISTNSFQLYYDDGLTLPVDATVSITGSGGYVYGYRLPYEYFLTYKLKNNLRGYSTLPYAELIPFNFQSSNIIDNVTGEVEVEIPTLTHLVDDVVLEGFEADTYEIIIGKYKQDAVDPYSLDSKRPYNVEETIVVGSYDLHITLGGSQYHPSQTINISTWDTLATQIQTLITNTTYETDLTNPAYDILKSLPVKHYDITPLSETIYTAGGAWFVGNILYKQQAEQYRLKLEVIIPADKWNGTTNPTFKSGEPLMNEKYITEVAFYIQQAIDQATGLAIPGPYIYAKIAPAIKKNNSVDITLSIELDF